MQLLKLVTLKYRSGRAGHDSDMAASVLFLAGPGGVFYNEQIICPDGGSTLIQPSVK